MKIEKLEKITKMFNILGFVLANPNCTVPEIRAYLEIQHKPGLSKEEKELYFIISKIEREGYIYKIPIKKEGSGGAQFRIRLSNSGFVLLSRFKTKLQDYFPIPLHEVSPLKEDDPKMIGLKKILHIYRKEVYDIIEHAVEKILEETLKIKFENIEFTSQKKFIDALNEAVRIIGKKTEEISKLFF